LPIVDCSGWIWQVGAFDVMHPDLANCYQPFSSSSASSFFKLKLAFQ
jgi:hypothetical protein